VTISIFPELDEALVEPPVSDTTGATGRWVLHRAGILNVWQYDRVELRFAGGRLLLRGKNGAGKSKALEIMLPFLFDGDTRRLDAAGRDRTTVRWLMSDGRPNGNHVGYVWLELRCADDNGDERFHTLGAGLKVSTATGRSDAWFFSTERRVGVDLHLERAGECLSIDKLKDALGEEAVTASGSEHRRRVGRHLFGLFDQARYDNLLHLLHRLRDPNIGNRVEAGELANVLSDALPPIDDRVLTDAAGRFDDLESIREQVERADRTAAALGGFLGVYRGYTRTVLGRRAAAVEAAERRRVSTERDRNRAERTASTAADTVDRRTVALDALTWERAERDDDRRAMEASEAYRAHLDLADRDARVAALDQAAQSAETTASRSTAAHERAVDESDRTERDVADDTDTVLSSSAAVDGLMAASGLDRALLGPPTVVPGRVPDVATIAAAERRAQATSAAAEVRHQRAGEVRELAVKARRAADKADAADERAAESEAVVEADRRTLRERRSTCAGVEARWADAVRDWTRAGAAADAGADWADVLGRLDDRRDDARWTESVRAAVADALASPLRAARTAAAAAEAAVASATGAVTAADQRVAELEQHTEARPEAGRFRQAERDSAAGAPFYELVDVLDTVAPGDAAGLEAALEASGLLDAWVSADGVAMHARTHDVVVVAADTPVGDGTPALADVLRPAVPANCPVSAETVADLLAAVGWGEQSHRSTWVTNDGRWKTGVLRGAWSKPAIEFIGAGSRRETRRRQLEQARADLTARRDELDVTRGTAAAAAQYRDVVEALPATLPDPAEVDDVRRDVLAAERAVALATGRHDADRRASEESRTAARRLAVAVADRAAADALPVTIDDLDAAIDAMRRLIAVLGQHRRSLKALGRAVDRLAEQRARVAERAAEAEADEHEAAGRRREHERAATELIALREALGTTVQDVLDRHGAVVERIRELETALIPGADVELRAALEQRATATVRLEEAQRAEADAEAALTDVAAQLEAAVALPGVMLAATGTAFDGATTGVDLAHAVAPLVDGDHEIGDTMVLARYDRLSDALTGGYDTAIEEIDGIKVIHVDDDSGRRPLAVVAAVLDEEARAARGRLVAREREVLERFLLRELADEVRSKLLDAHDLVAGTNRTLHGVRTSHGKGARLEWTLHDEAPEAARMAARLLVDELRDDDGDAALRDALLALIDTERSSDPTASYEQHLRRALDYRAWHRFAVKVTDTAHPGSQRNLSNRLGLSQGEQRVLSYLALFAAAAAQFEAIARDAPEAPRLLLLDDAFAKVDEPTHGQLLGLLVDLRLDFVLTSERMWGCFPTVPSLEIYEAIRDPSTPGVALMHFRWDGHRRTLVAV
jgi:uncharacterized protein (TIGR02680 family)